MVSKNFIFFLLSIFITTVVIVVILQYSSNSNINRLIEGNQELLSEFKVKSEVQEMIADLAFISTAEKNLINWQSRQGINEIAERVKKLKGELAYLNTLQVSAGTRLKLDQLNIAATALLRRYDAVLDQFYATPGIKADRSLAPQVADDLTNKIAAITNELTTAKDTHLIQLIEEADQNAKMAKKAGAILALIAITASIYAFGYIFRKVRKQLVLIDRLNESEKKVRAAAIMKENFMANMSHEIRTPMNAILGFTHLLKKRSLDPESATFVHAIEQSGEHLLTIINDLLDYSKIEAGMMRIESSAFSLRSVLHSVETMFEGPASAKNISLELTIEKDIPDVLTGDAVRLTQIMTNLVNNAVKFTNAGTIDINVLTSRRSGKSVDVTFTVKDTGIGISADKLSSVFDRFQQADEDTTRKYGGTGLGLSIVKQLVELQHGNIQVSSIPGKSSEFVFTIPYSIATSMVENKHPDPSVSPWMPLSKKNIAILVAEDNAMNRSLLGHLLKEWNFDLHFVNNGLEAVEAIRSHAYNLVLMDIQMPQMDGYTATQQIRNELHSNVPIIAMTAHAMAGEREKCLGYGMNEYIAKPFRETDLHEMIKRFIDAEMHGPELSNKQGNEAHHFKALNLAYLQDLSGGDKYFERNMLEQFIQQVPAELETMANEFTKRNFGLVATTAHNLKTSVSFAGLLEQLAGPLDYIEQNVYNTIEKDRLQGKIHTVNTICMQAVEEAKNYLYGFNKPA